MSPTEKESERGRVTEGVGQSDVRQSAGRIHTFTYLVARAADLLTQVGILYCEMY